MLYNSCNLCPGTIYIEGHPFKKSYFVSIRCNSMKNKYSACKTICFAKAKRVWCL